MLAELAVVGGLMGLFVGLLEVSHRLDETAPGPLTARAAVREAMRGPDGAAVRAEFQRSGIAPVDRLPRPVGFGM